MSGHLISLSCRNGRTRAAPSSAWSRFRPPIRMRLPLSGRRRRRESMSPSATPPPRRRRSPWRSRLERGFRPSWQRRRAPQPATPPQPHLGAARGRPADRELHRRWFHLPPATFRLCCGPRGSTAPSSCPIWRRCLRCRPGSTTSPHRRPRRVGADGRLSVAGTPNLAGAGRTLAEDVAMATTMAGLTLAEALRLATVNPAASSAGVAVGAGRSRRSHPFRLGAGRDSAQDRGDDRRRRARLRCGLSPCAPASTGSTSRRAARPRHGGFRRPHPAGGRRA